MRKRDLSGLLLSSLLASFFLVSCGGNDPSDPGNRLVGVLAGHVELADEQGTLLSDHSGAVITVEGTDYTGTTDAQGNWSIENLPAGTYVVSTTKDGFTTVKEFGVAFVGGGTDYLSQVLLVKLPAFTVGNLKLEMVDQASRLYLEDSASSDSLTMDYVTIAPQAVVSGTFSEPISPGSHYRVQFYLGRDATVSKEPGTFVGMFEDIITEREGLAAGLPPLQGDFTFWIDKRLSLLGFSKGETIYVVAYPVAVQGATYYDPVQQRTIDTRLVDAPSNVASFVWQ